MLFIVDGDCNNQNTRTRPNIKWPNIEDKCLPKEEQRKANQKFKIYLNVAT